MSDAVPVKPPTCIHTRETGKHEWQSISHHHQAGDRFWIPRCDTCGWVDTEQLVKEANRRLALHGVFYDGLIEQLTTVRNNFIGCTGAWPANRMASAVYRTVDEFDAVLAAMRSVQQGAEMTGYHIRIGYNSHMNGREKTEAFEALKAVVLANRVPDLIAAEARREIQWRVESAPNIDPGETTLMEYAQSYAVDNDDATITVIEPINGSNGEIMQCASGGGDGRDVKELLRRAFCRLIIFEMHRRGIEVNLVVA